MELTEEQSNLVRLLHQRYVNNGDTLARKAAWEIEGMAKASNNVTPPSDILTRLDLIGELKPCPFCGKPAEHKREADHHGEFFRLGCPDKDCCAHMTYYTELQEDEPAAIAAWNRRANIGELTSPEYISRLRGAKGEVAEPVAWRRRHGDATWDLYSHKPRMPTVPDGWQIEPLYASPVAGEVKG